jgi:phosphatidylglycerol:prolipoprotein diacylglycerol transferase
VLIAMALWARKAKRNLLDVYDFIAPMVPLGYAAGRLGNFINHELPGRLADPSLPWAMIWPAPASKARATRRRFTRCWSTASSCS